MPQFHQGWSRTTFDPFGSYSSTSRLTVQLTLDLRPTLDTGNFLDNIGLSNFFPSRVERERIYGLTECNNSSCCWEDTRLIKIKWWLQLWFGWASTLCREMTWRMSFKRGGNMEYRVFQKSSPLKRFGIFSLWLSLFGWNFANLLAIHIHIYPPIFVDLS